MNVWHDGQTSRVHVVLSSLQHGGVLLTTLDSDGSVTETREVARVALAQAMREIEPRHPRWVWSDTAVWYPSVLAEGLTVERCVDLRLSHAILRASALTRSSELAMRPPSAWDEVRPAQPPAGLFEFEPIADVDPVAEFRLQQRALRDAPGGGLGLLLAAESAGALIAAEMTFAGVPWRTDEHDRILTGCSVRDPSPVIDRRNLRRCSEVKLRSV